MKFSFLTFPVILLVLLLASSCKKEAAYKIGVSQCSYDDWRLKLNDEIDRQTMIYDDTEVTILSAFDDPQKQVEDVRSFIRSGVDVIIASPQNTENLNAVLAEARKRGIKVILFDRGASRKCYDVFLGADNNKLGSAAGDYLLSHLREPGRFLEITGAPLSSPTLGRSAGFRKSIKMSPDSELLASASGFWDESRAEHVVDSLLSLYPSTNAIYAHNDRMAIGARKATIRHGRKDILIAGADGVPQLGIKAVADGTIDATFIYPTAGAELITLGRRAAMGEKLQDEVIISSALPVDKTNAEILLQLARSIEDEKGKIAFLHDEVSRYTTLHTQQRLLIISIFSIMLLLAGISFVILKAYWMKKKNQAMLSVQNKELEAQRDELASLNARLEEATNEKLTFYTNVSHDLRTPLTLISEPLNQIKNDSNLTPVQSSMLRMADKNARILMRLINQILDFRKFENGKLTLNLSETDVKQCFSEWTDSFRSLARKRGLRLNLDFGTLNPPMLAMDTEKIERVFFNLMSNAFKFTPPNGTVTIKVSIADDTLRVSISDTGKGIDKANIDKIFERFYQVDMNGPRGTGIGLTLTKAFVNIHGGQINVDSELGRGSTFTFTLPVRHVSFSPTGTSTTLDSQCVVDELAEIEVPEPKGINQSKPLLLIIDDTADLRKLLREILSEDYGVIEAPNGEQGMKLAAKYIPDLIICDVMMPGIGGYECCRRIKAEIATSHIPVIMLTACSLDEQRAQSFESGADGHISKPFSHDVLKAQIRSTIANRKLILDTKNPSRRTETAENRQKRPEHTYYTTDGIENEFYQRFQEIVEKEIANPDISVEEIGNRLGLGRTQFYRKIKAISNFSPNELLRHRRLRKAYDILISSEITVSEVAYSVGFTSPSYFTRCFKEFFGELPLDVQKRTSKSV